MTSYSNNLSTTGEGPGSKLRTTNADQHAGRTSAGKPFPPPCAPTKLFSCSGVRAGNWEKEFSGNSPTLGASGAGGGMTLEEPFELGFWRPPSLFPKPLKLMRARKQGDLVQHFATITYATNTTNPRMECCIFNEPLIPFTAPVV